MQKAAFGDLKRTYREKVVKRTDRLAGKLVNGKWQTEQSERTDRRKIEHGRS